MTSTPTSTSRGQFEASVAANIPLCREHFRLVLTVESFPKTDPGQFVQIACRDVDLGLDVFETVEWQPGSQLDLPIDEFTSPTSFLRRPFSLAGRRNTKDGVELDIIHRVVGVGTQWLSELGEGDRVGILGPLGNRFSFPASDQTAILVGGGVGIPPMLYLAEALAGKKAVAFCGALSRDLLPMKITGEASKDDAKPLPVIDEFARHGIPSVITTDDGSYGFRGFVTQALERYLDANKGIQPIIYTCGPEPMMKRVGAIAAERNIECQIAVERAMACGMGTCQSCCIKVRKPDKNQPPLPGSEWCYRLACTDGPVFKGSDLLW